MGPIVAGAVITSNGKLTPNFEYIADIRFAYKKMNLRCKEDILFQAF